MTINIEELKRDREEGTDGPWRVDGDRDDYETFIVGSPSWGCERYGVKGEWEVAKIDVMDNRPNETEANARRIARLPDLEAAFLEAVETIKSIAAGASVNLKDDLAQGWRKIAADRMDMARNFLEKLK